MKWRIDYDGDAYWVVGNGEIICGHATYGQAERTLWLMFPEQYRPKWVNI